MKKLIALSLCAALAGAAVVVTTEQPAMAQVRINIAPPQPIYEVPPAAPSPAHVWVPGYWRWEAGPNKHVWTPGSYQLPPAAGNIWYPHRWFYNGSQWEYVQGRWGAPTGGIVEVQGGAPPALQQEVVGRPPSANHFWVGGHWRWDGGRYAWSPGYWEVRRNASVWEPAHWQYWGGRYRFVPGHWR